MKSKICLFSVMLFLFTTQSFGQFKFGVKAGINLAGMSFNNLSAGAESKMRLSYHFGGIVEYSFYKNLSVETGLLLSAKGGETTSTGSFSSGSSYTGSLIFSPVYIEIPLNEVYIIYINKIKVRVFAGPYCSIGVAGKIEFRTTSLSSTSGIQNSYESNDIKFGYDSKSTMPLIDYGLNLGAGMDFHNFLIRFQYGLGMESLLTTDTNNEGSKNRVISISFGYMFGKNKANKLK